MHIYTADFDQDLGHETFRFVFHTASVGSGRNYPPYPCDPVKLRRLSMCPLGQLPPQF